MLQLPSKCATFIPYHPGPVTHTTPAGRVLDGVRDQTQRSASLAFSCTGPDLVPVLPARCHRCAGASGTVRSDGRVLHVPSRYQQTLRHSATDDKRCRKEKWLKRVASLKYIDIYTYVNDVFYNRFEVNTVLLIHLEGCLTIHLPHEIK